MKPNPVHRLPAPLEAAVQRLKMAAREAAERTIESLGLAALASTNAFHRDGLLGAQFELNRKSAVFVLTFNDAFDERIVREVAPRTAAPGAPAPGTLGLPAAPPPAAPTNWDALSLVEDHEVEVQISAERFGLEIAHDCEWELRELDAYVGSLLGFAGTDKDRNPLRPEVVGHAMIRGIEAVSERAEIRKVLSAELSRSLGGLLRAAYADIVAELRGAGVQPLGLTVRGRPPRGPGGGGDSVRGSSYDTAARALDDERLHAGRGGAAPGYGPASGWDSRLGGRRSGSGHGTGYGAGQGTGYGAGYGGAPGTGYGSGHGGAPGFAPSTRAGGPGYGRGTPIGQVDPALMTLIRRLHHSAPVDDGGASDFGDAGFGAPLPNLIRAHRDELRQASSGQVDHMVIDVIGFLFDQILADPKVPPQMAKLLARLQLPVLRAALGDPGFFSSRRHPVRRFVNRIASLGAAFEDFGDDEARSFLHKVRELVQEVVEGDFDQIETYEAKLAALEAFVAEQAASEVRAQGDPAALLSEKEDQARLRALYAERLAGELKDISAPAFLRDFISRVWSQVLLRAAERGGADGELAQRMRRAGRELFLSVQPKATPALRKAFLAELPKLMQELTEGMNLIGWPEAQRRAFFGQLMPAHAEALKSPGSGARQLDINLEAKRVEGALQRPLPSREELRAVPPSALPVLTEEVDLPAFTAAEAARVGLVDERAVDWTQPAAAPAPAEAAEAAERAAAADPTPPLPGLPAAAEPPEPASGRALADNVQIGFAYQMQLKGEWQKVRLAHVSPGRSFFIFTHGARHKETVSLTQRMLVKLAETGRLRAYETAYLIDRATARARKQLASLGAGAAAAAR